MKNLFLYLVSFLFLSIGSLFAESLSLEKAIQTALKHHPDVRTFSLKVKQSESAYDSAFASYLPQVSLQANYNALQTYVLPQNGTFHTIDDDGWSAGASLQQKIWDFSKTSSLVNASKLDSTISELSLKDFKSLLRSQVKGLYALMYVQKEAIDVRKKDLEAKEAYYAQAKALVKEGLKTDADASRFLSSVYIAQDNLAISRASFLKAKNSLSLYMGESISDEVELENSFESTPHIEKETLQKDILQNNYQLQIVSKSIEKNQLIHKSTQASHYGSIDAVASYTHFDTLNAYDAKNAGIVLNIPLYSGGRTSAEVQKADISTQIAKAQEASELLKLQEQSESLLIDIERYKKTIAAKKAQEHSAQKTLNVLEGRYKEGLATYIEVLDATSLLLNAKLGLLEAYYSKSIALNNLEYLQGK